MISPASPLALAIDALEPVPVPGEDAAVRLRRLLIAVRAIGYRAVVLSAASPGLRPRDLDRSARRELAALLRREELGFAGLDLWIPPEHYASPTYADRASAATVAACELAEELARLSRLAGGAVGRERSIVCVGLPETPDAGVLAAVRAAADRTGAAVCNVAWPLETAIGRDADDPIVLGMDAAAAILAGADPVMTAAKWGARLGAVRIGDASRRAGVRVAVGGQGGELDIAGFKAAVSLGEERAALVADVRGVSKPRDAAAAILRAWSGAA